MKVRHDDGTEVDIEAGDAYVIEPGHDGWVIVDEPVVMYEFDNKAAETYAKKWSESGRYVLSIPH